MPLLASVPLETASIFPILEGVSMTKVAACKKTRKGRAYQPKHQHWPGRLAGLSLPFRFAPPTPGG